MEPKSESPFTDIQQNPTTANSVQRLQSNEAQSQSINGLARIASRNDNDMRLAPTQRLSGVGDPKLGKKELLTKTDSRHV